jgi:hypothetical protein
LEYIESRHEFIDDKCRIYTLGACARENSQAIAQLVDVVKENKRPEVGGLLNNWVTLSEASP